MRSEWLAFIAAGTIAGTRSSAAWRRIRPFSEQTTITLAGHVSKPTLALYSHIRSAAMQAAIATLERANFEADFHKSPDSRLSTVSSAIRRLTKGP